MSIFKRFAKRLRSDESGFTMLELLVVVGVLAIVGGSMIAAYDGVESQAAKGTATNTIAAVDNAVRSYVVTEGSLPNNVESLMAATPTTLDTTQTDSQGISIVTVQTASATEAGVLSSNIAGKFAPMALTTAQLSSLNNAGITIARYIHLDGNGTGSNAIMTVIEDGDKIAGTSTVDDIADITIPAHAFEAPRPGNRNRGRGYPKLLVATDEVAQYNPAGGYSHLKVGAGANDIVVGFGIGNASTIVGVDSNSTGGVGNVRLTSAPFYGGVAKNEYPHYVMLVNLGPSGTEFGTAKLVTVLDAKGDFLDEEFAETIGQKQ